ncbi:MAG: hypothetical protein PHC38_07850 [Weeksellaceae bacterium]|nr:hypothetical protein [Weeksellaceae bacterium]
MKKLYSTSEYKTRNTKRAKDRLKQKLLSKEKAKAKRRAIDGVPIVEQRERRVLNHFESLKAPSNFSFVENTVEILAYLENIQNHIKHRKPILINLREITNLNNDAIVLLLALIKNPKITKDVAIKGNYPRDEELRKIFQESGVFKANGNEDEPMNYILTRKNKKAEGGMANELIKRATSIVFGQEARCPGVYRALMESMANTCYHAKPQQIGQETWWLTVYHDRKENKVSFAFIDLGVGIFKSSNISGFREKLSTLFGIKDNRDVLKEIISGRKMSSTKIPYRGKGLPTIYKGLERNYYSNLKLISNDVKADLSAQKYEKLTKEFNGTFLYWELNSTNRWTC